MFYSTLSLPSFSTTSTTATSSFAGPLYIASSTPGGSALFAVGTSTSGRARLWVDKNTGNVGIGTAAPDGPLDVYGASVIPADNGSILRIASTDAAAIDKGGSLAFLGNADATRVFAIISGFKETTTASDYAGYLGFYPRASGGTNVERMRITSTGNVGIGTTTPGTLLAVQGAVSLFLSGTATTNGVCHTGDNINAADSTVGRQLVACSGAPNDYAEWYPTQSDVMAGDIAAIGSSTITYQAKGADPEQGTIVDLGIQKIPILKKATQGDPIMGIVSTAPFQTIGSDVRSSASSSKPIALSGRT